MVGLTDIDGIGDARADSMEEAGYGSLEAVAEADPEELSEKLNRVSEDRALEFIVEAGRLLEDAEEVEFDGESDFDLTPSEVSDEVSVTEVDDEVDTDVVEKVEADVEEEEETESESEVVENEGPRGPFTVTIEFEDKHTTFAYIHGLRDQIRNNGNQPTVDVLKECLYSIDNLDQVEYELDEWELNTLHSAVKQSRVSAQSNNEIDDMEALREIERAINDVRRVELF